MTYLLKRLKTTFTQKLVFFPKRFLSKTKWLKQKIVSS